MRAGEVVPARGVPRAGCATTSRPSRRSPGASATERASSSSGAFCEQPPLGLIKTIERAGCYIVDDDFLLGNRFLAGDVPLEGDPAREPRAGLRAARAADLHALRARSGREAAPACAERVGGRAGRRHHLRRGELLRSGAARPADAARRGGGGRAFPCIAFQYAENTGQFQQFREQAGTFADSIKLWGGSLMTEAEKDRSMELQKEMIAEHYRRLEAAPGDGRAGRLHLRAGEPDGADPLLRRAAGAARDQRAAVGDARQERGLHRRGREGRPLRGRLHLREVRHRDGRRPATSARPGRGCRSPTCCCSPTPAATPS